MTYSEAKKKIVEINKATKHIKRHVKIQCYYDNTSWINLLNKLKIDKNNLEELIASGELEDNKEIKNELDPEVAKFWGIKVITL